MADPVDIVIVWPSDKEFVIAPIERDLRALGHRVTRYREIGDAERAGDGVLANADIVMPFPEFHSTRAILSAAPRLRAGVSPVTGIDGFDLAAATDLGILVANTQVSESHESMAEATILFMLAVLYDIKGSEAILRNNLPSRKPVARMAKGKTIGLIGFGQIAQAVAARLTGWDVRLQVYAPRLRVPLPANVKHVEFEELLRTSDIVSILSSLNAETRKLLNADRLALMKPGAILINTARGAITDEAAVYRLAKEGRLRNIAVDVFEAEPIARDHPYLDLPDAILTNHCIGHTIDTIEAMPRAALDSVARVLAGEPPQHVKNPDVLAKWRSRWAK